MKRRFYGTCGIAAFAFAACSGGNSMEAWNDNADPAADVSSSSVSTPISSLAESSGSVEQSSSSLFGLSSSAPVPESSSSEAELSSSSAALSSSSAELLSSSSTVLSSSSSSCRRMQWRGYDNDSTVVMEACGDSAWPQDAVVDGVWRVVETDSSCPYCGVYDERVGQVVKGNSSIAWNEGVGENGEVLTSTVLHCGGVCGTAVLEKGTLTYHPFVSVGFTLARDDSGKPVPVDVSTWNGICISYSSAAAPSLELDLGDSLNAAFGYAQPTVSLPKSSTGTRRCLTWDQFKFPSWFKGEAEGWRENTGLVASKHLVGVRFKLQALEGNYIFHIAFLGSNDLGVERFY